MQETEALPGNSLDQIALHGPLQQLLADHQAKTGRLPGRTRRAMMEQKEPAANGAPETKNG